MLYYSTNPSVTTVCSLREKVERIANKVMNTSAFSYARNELYRNSHYSSSSFEQDVKDMVARELRLNKDDRAKKLSSLHNAVVKHIVRKFC